MNEKMKNIRADIDTMVSDLNGKLKEAGAKSDAVYGQKLRTDAKVEDYNGEAFAEYVSIVESNPTLRYMAKNRESEVIRLSFSQKDMKYSIKPDTRLVPVMSVLHRCEDHGVEVKGFESDWLAKFGKLYSMIAARKASGLLGEKWDVLPGIKLPEGTENVTFGYGTNSDGDLLRGLQLTFHRIQLGRAFIADGFGSIDLLPQFIDGRLIYLFFQHGVQIIGVEPHDLLHERIVIVEIDFRYGDGAVRRSLISAQADLDLLGGDG